MKNFVLSVFGSPLMNALYNISLTEKFIAVVGKYLIMLAQFPLKNARGPSST